MEILELNVQGMRCGACVKHVTKALMSVPGVAHVDVDLENGRAKVRADLQAGSESLIAALASEDYPATVVSIDDAAAPPKAGGCDSGSGSNSGCCCR
ncbi:heavy-metal-associated domain-containing protein [Rhodoferax bucti]|jgi:copper chaperone|uniref:HMA domain-containing protein n=1 Tax=Curvibacter symbiont subsp. Hydra magnipapillata TaxID=667019 RepID=C9YBC8_CURXX|nr:heavy metal-associated domain-containing protein [Rhodoferax bucti]CBA29864.1 hypothetical protein Csp_A14290 [Curvibacter putative symbiont of Hydra magnipapillata]